MTTPATSSPPAARPAPSRGVAATRRIPPGLLRLGLGLLVSGAILVYLFAAQGADPWALVPLVRAISLPGLLAYVAISAVALALRALRYRVLLGGFVPFWPLVLVTAVRNMAVDLIPARAGAAASYLYLVTARLGLPLEAGVASFALSFILDTLAVAPLLVLALLAVGSAPMPPAVLAGGSLAILLGSVAALWMLAPIFRIAASVAGRLPAAGRLVPLLGAAAAEVERSERARTLVPALGLSLLLRLTKYASYYCLLQALLASRDEAGASPQLPARFPRGRGCGVGRVPAAAHDHESWPVRGGWRCRLRLLAGAPAGPRHARGDGVPRPVAGPRLRARVARARVDHGGEAAPRRPRARPGR